MSISMCVLGSGSKGNSTLLAIKHSDGSERFCLIDCGLSPRATRSRLAPLGLSLDDIHCILLTHLDTDHFHIGWPAVLARQPLPVHVYERHRDRAVRAGLDGRSIRLFRDQLHLPHGATAEAVHLAHDQLGTVGFVIEHDSVRLGFATDLGNVPESLLERFVRLDALAIESNYDRAMQLASPRPMFLKRRIMGGMGHLSNEQSLEGVKRVAEQSRLRHVVALHLSQQCNNPRLILDLYTREARELRDVLTISHQHEPTPVLHVTPASSSNPTQSNGSARHGEQLAMF